MAEEIVFARTAPVAEVIERWLGATSVSIAAALYRLNSPRLARALEDALSRGVQVRVLLDCNKYGESEVTRDWVANRRVPVRVLYGRRGQGSKMHHKFVILDGRVVLAGSYNWTLESEEQNYESLLILRDPHLVESYRKEFEALWLQATQQ